MAEKLEGGVPPGTVFPFERSPDHFSATADSTVALFVPSPGIALMALSWDGRMLDFIAGGDGALASTNGGVVPIELGLIKMAPAVALETAISIIRVGIKFNVIEKEEARAKMNAMLDSAG